MWPFDKKKYRTVREAAAAAEEKLKGRKRKNPLGDSAVKLNKATGDPEKYYNQSTGQKGSAEAIKKDPYTWTGTKSLNKKPKGGYLA